MASIYQINNDLMPKYLSEAIKVYIETQKVWQQFIRRFPEKISNINKQIAGHISVRILSV